MNEELEICRIFQIIREELNILLLTCNLYQKFNQLDLDGKGNMFQYEIIWSIINILLA